MKVHNPLFYIKNIYTKCSKLKLILDFFKTSKMGRIENGVENVFYTTKCLKYQLRLFLIKASVRCLLSQKSQCQNVISYLRKDSVQMLSLSLEKPVFEYRLLSLKRQCSLQLTFFQIFRSLLDFFFVLIFFSNCSAIFSKKTHRCKYITE